MVHSKSFIKLIGILLLKALKQLVWRLLVGWKNTLDLKTCSISIFSEIFSPDKHVLAALFRKKKSTFLACNSEQVYAAILELSKNNNLFQNHQIYSHWILEMYQNFLDMASVRLQMWCIRVKWRQTKIEGTCYKLLPAVTKL